MRRKKYLSGTRVREYRLKAGIGTQKELAELTGISPTIISELERGKRSVTPKYADRIAEKLGVKTSVLWDETRRPPTGSIGTAMVYRQKSNRLESSSRSHSKTN